MKNAVQIVFNFGTDYKDLVFADIVITDFEQAIKLVQLLNIRNIQLKQKINIGKTQTWDNF